MIYKFERKLKGANQVDAEGEELTINNAGRKVQKFELSGRSEQETRELSQKQTSGEQVKLVDVDQNKFIDIFANGNNEQKTTKGKQLFNKDNPDFSATGSNAKYVSIKNGFKIVCNKDETTWKGSAFNIRLGSINDFIGTLRIKTTAIVSGNGTFRPGLALFYGNANNFSDSDKVAEGDGNYGGTTNFDIKTNITEQSDFTHLYLIVYGNGSGNAEHYMNDGDYTIYDNFIITLNNDDMTYEPYTGGISSPNPDYKQDVEVIDGYNKLDFKTMLKNADAEFTESKGVFTISSRRMLYDKPFKLNLKPNYTYTMYQEYQMQETPNLRLEILKGETYDVVATSWTLKEDLQDRKITFTTDENSNYFIRGNWGAAVEPLIYNQPILVEGTELKPYLPYGYIGLEQSGKNKVDFINYVEKVFDSSKVEKLDDGSYKFKHADGSYSLYEGLLKPPCTLSFWAKNDTGESVSSYTFSFKIFYEDGTYDRVSMITNGNFARKEFKINKNVIKIANTYTSTKPFTIIKDVQLEEGSTATSYEPHHETKVIPIDLQGNTLAKVGDIKDKLIIHRNGEVELEKKVRKYVFTGEELWNQSSYGEKSWILPVSYVSAEKTNSTINVISNIFNGVSSDDRSKELKNKIYTDNSSGAIVIRDTQLTTLEDVRVATKDNYIYYKLITPQTIKLPSIEPIKLWQGTVNIEIVGNLPADMDINYNILPAMPSSDYPSLIESIENKIKITICNKNIFNGFFTTNGVWKDDGTINYVIQSKLYWRTDFIKIPNKNIYFSSKQLNIFSSAILLEFDTDKKYITSNKIYQVNSNLNNVSLNENTRFIAIQWNLQNATEIEGLFTDFQIEVGPTASPYISHQEQTIIFPLAEGQKLRSLPNGVKDYLAEDGIHKNVGIIILNGSGGTNESYYKALDNKFQLGANTKKGLLLKNLKTDNLKISVLSDKFLGVPWNIMKDTIEGWQIALRQDGSYTYLRLLTTGIKDTKALETFLQNNNAIVEYPLAEEEIIPYTQEQQEIYSQLQNLELFRGCNHITVESSVKPTIKLSYYDGELDMTDYKYNLQFKKHMQEM